jgi:hypothetical protein
MKDINGEVLQRLAELNIFPNSKNVFKKVSRAAILRFYAFVMNEAYKSQSNINQLKVCLTLLDKYKLVFL